MELAMIKLALQLVKLLGDKTSIICPECECGPYTTRASWQNHLECHEEAKQLHE